MESKDTPGEGRMERKKKETRQKIIRVAIDLFGHQGFNNTTMEQIAEEADIARKTLYNHFPVKEAIVDEYVKGISKGIAQESLKTFQDVPDTRGRLVAALSKTYEWVEVNPEITCIALGYRLKNSFYGLADKREETGTQSIMAEIIRNGRQAGEIRRDVPIELLVWQLDLLRGAIVLEWLKDPSKFELRNGMTKIVDLFMDGAVDRGEG